MAERYRRIYEFPCAKYADGAPILINAGVMLEDRLSRSTLVQLKMQNISDGVISAVKLSILPAEPAGEELESIEYIYQGIKAARDEFFGQKTAIVIPDKRTASFTVQVKQVVFADGNVWYGDDLPWTDIKSPKTLVEAYGDEQLSTQFSIRYGSDCSFLPDEDRGLWFCACGLINRADESKCHGCRRVYSALKNVNLGSLRSESLQRQELEKQEKLEDEAHQSVKRSRLIKLSLVLIPLLICIIIILATVPRYMAQKNDYATAVTLLENGKYDQAREAFLALGDYADSAEQAEYNVTYKKALYVIDCAKSGNTDALLMLGMKRSELAEDETVSVALYKAADELFAGLGDYKDSQTQRQIAQAAVEQHYAALKLAEFESAAALLENGSYLQARDAFISMGDYMNSQEMAKESMYLRAVRLCELTEKYSMRGIYSSISNETGVNSVFYIKKDAFAELGSAMSAELRDILREDGVEINIEDPPAEGFIPVCTDISRLFEELGDYKESAQYKEKVIAAGDFTKPFYDLCAAGQLYEAILWLDAYEYEFEAREKWMSVLQTYVHYCGNWALSKGDPTLIPQTVGITAQCESFSSAVVIIDYVIKLRIYVNGNTDYPIELPLDAEGTRFSINSDGVNTYIAAISNTGRFNYSRYSSYAISKETHSCEYVRV